MDKTSPAPSRAVSRILTITSFYSAFVNFTGVIIVGMLKGVLPVLVISLIFLALFVVTGYASWRGSRYGFLAAAIISLADILVLQNNPLSSAGTILQSPGGSTPFVLFLPFYVAMAIAVPYGLYGFYGSGRAGAVTRQVSRPSLLAFVALGVVIGGLLVGSIAASTESNLLASSGGHADITIVLDSASPTNSNFYLPANLTARVGQSVTWVNHDSSPHTVTSTTGAFDSGNIPAGGTYSFTFTKAGSYQYYCTYHSWMKGTVTVTG